MGSSANGSRRTALSVRSARLATSLRFLLRSLSLRGSSFLLALLAITVGATVTATMLNIRADLGAKMSRELRRYGPNLLVTPALGDGTSLSPPTLSEAGARALPDAIVAAGALSAPSVSAVLIASGTVRALSREEGWAAAGPSAGEAPGSSPPGSTDSAQPGPAGHPRSPAGTTLALPDSDLPGLTATIVGSDFQALQRLYPSWRVNGTWPGSGDTECLVGEALAARAGLTPGRRVVVHVGSSLKSQPTTPQQLTGSDKAGSPQAPTALVCTVSGLLSTGETEDDELFVPLLRLQALAGLPGRVSLAALSVDGGVQAVTDAAAAAHSALPGVWARPLRQIAAAQGAILGKLQRMMVLLTLVVLVLTGLCLVTTLMAIVVERGSEIGLMRSIGAADSEILEMFLGEVGLLGILGSAIGIALGALGAHVIGSRLFGAPIEPRAAVVPTVLLISLGLCLISVLVPLRRALSVQPAAALRGD